MILARKELIAAWKSKRIRFSPEITEKQIGLSSIDIRLGTVFSKLKDRPGVTMQPARAFDPTDHTEIEDVKQSTGFTSGGGPIFRLKPQEFRLAWTLEEITLPNDVAANVQGKSGLARAGLAVHITAPHIHPGFSGPITLEMYNHGPWTLEFAPGEDRICQLIFYKVTSRVNADAVKSLSSYSRPASPFPRKRGT